MRYPKGGIDLRSTQDTMLLQQVLLSRHISQQQLWEFMQHRAREYRRRVFTWRMKRLVDHELVIRGSAPNRAWVYSLSQAGAEHLVGLGETAALLVTGGLVEIDHGSVQHSLELNDIHLALLRAGGHVSWQSELEIRALNEFTAYGYAKDYDAIVKIERAGRSYQFALEYERSPKTPDKYARVRQVLETENKAGCILYVMPSYPLLSYVATFFERCATPVYFALSDDFRNNTLDADVMDSRRLKSVPLHAVLDAVSRRAGGELAALPSY